MILRYLQAITWVFKYQYFRANAFIKIGHIRLPLPGIYEDENA